MACLANLHRKTPKVSDLIKCKDIRMLHFVISKTKCYTNIFVSDLQVYEAIDTDTQLLYTYTYAELKEVDRRERKHNTQLL